VIAYRINDPMHVSDADRRAHDERHCLGFGFAHCLGRRSIAATLVKQLVGELVDGHRAGVG